MAKKMQVLEVGMKVKILEKGKVLDKVIDEAIIRRVGTGGRPIKQELSIESLRLQPGNITEFALIRHNKPSGWRVLFKDPMTGERCFSKRAPVYTFEPTDNQGGDT